MNDLTPHEYSKLVCGEHEVGNILPYENMLIGYADNPDHYIDLLHHKPLSSMDLMNSGIKLSCSFLLSDESEYRKNKTKFWQNNIDYLSYRLYSAMMSNWDAYMKIEPFAHRGDVK